MELDRKLIQEGLLFINIMRGVNIFGDNINTVTEYIYHYGLTKEQYIYNVNNAISLEKGYITVSHLINPLKESENNKVKIIWQKNKYNGVKGKSREFEFDDKLKELMDNY